MLDLEGIAFLTSLGDSSQVARGSRSDLQNPLNFRWQTTLNILEIEASLDQFVLSGLGKVVTVKSSCWIPVAW